MSQTDEMCTLFYDKQYIKRGINMVKCLVSIFRQVALQFNTKAKKKLT